MQVLVTSLLELTQSEAIKNTQVLKSFLKGGDFADNDFQIEQVHQKTIEVKAGTDIDSLDIFDFFNIAYTDATFVSIQIYNSDPEYYHINDCRFDLSIGDVVLGSHSVFNLLNMKDFSSKIEVTGVSVPESTFDTDKKAILVITLGSK